MLFHIYRGYEYGQRAPNDWCWIDEKSVMHSGFKTETEVCTAIDKKKKEKTS